MEFILLFFGLIWYGGIVYLGVLLPIILSFTFVSSPYLGHVFDPLLGLVFASSLVFIISNKKW
jgi:hypothetical protein